MVADQIRTDSTLPRIVSALGYMEPHPFGPLGLGPHQVAVRPRAIGSGTLMPESGSNHQRSPHLLDILGHQSLALVTGSQANEDITETLDGSHRVRCDFLLSRLPYVGRLA